MSWKHKRWRWFNSMQMLMLYLELLKKFHENLKKRFAHRCKFSTMISLNLFCFCKRYLPIWIEEWLGKIWWNIFTWKIRFLQSPKHGRYLWCRILEGKKSKDFWNKKLRRISPFVSLEQWIIASWCIWIQNMRLEIYELDPACVLIATEIAWQGALKWKKIKLDIARTAICY